MSLSEREKREIFAERQVEIQLVKSFPDISDGARAGLLRVALATAYYESHCQTGERLDLTAITAAAKRSELGQLIFARDEDEAGPTDHVNAIDGMTPQQKLEYAREHGLR